jgi:hypothetical protein
MCNLACLKTTGGFRNHYWSLYLAYCYMKPSNLTDSNSRFYHIANFVYRKLEDVDLMLPPVV